MSILSDRVQETRRLYDMFDVLMADSRKKLIVCPLPMHAHQANPTPSFGIFWRKGVQTFKCFGNCGLSGDVVDLVGYLEIPGYKQHDPTHTDMAVSLLEGRHRISIPKQEVRKSFNVMAWKDYLPIGREARRYAFSRGIQDHTIMNFKLGQYKNFLAIPTFFEGVCVGIKFRNVTGKGRRFWQASGSKASLFNLDAIAYTREPILVLKGEIPVMIAYQLGFLACGYTGGEGMNIEYWLPQIAFSKKKVFIGDNDSDPETNERMQEYIVEKADRANGIAKFPPSEYHDFDEWMLKDPDAVSTVREWMEEK